MAAQSHYFFVGIGGSGMSTLADLIRRQGHIVSGSDRGHDRGDVPEKFAALAKAGITLYPQDGSGVKQGVDVVVVSSAVEPDKIDDVKNAIAANIPIRKRAELLSDLFNARRGIGIAGTSGKTTTTGMTGWMLHAMGLDPTIANGGVMPNFVGHPQSLMGNAVGGKGDLFVAEMDESDKTIALFNADIAVLNNITLDHMPFDQVEPLFRDYLLRAKTAIVNLDDPRAASMAGVHANTLTYGIDKPQASLWASGLKHQAGGISFTLHDTASGQSWPCNLPVPGRHNVSNALAAFTVAKALGQPLDKAVTALEGFRGIKRRLEVLGTAGGVTVIDDFGHNPDKVTATLETLTSYPGRIIVMFQPHGFKPVREMRHEFAEAFAKGLRQNDLLTMPEIYYAGGTTTKDVSSADVINEVKSAGGDAHFFQTRDDAGAFMLANAQPGDRIVIMGARDDTLSEFANGLLKKLGAAPVPKIAGGAQP